LGNPLIQDHPFHEPFFFHLFFFKGGNKMSWESIMNSRYHTQDQSNYCGPATAMMILAEMGVPYSDLDQDDLYAEIHSHNAHPSGWSSDAEGLRYTLNDRKPTVHLGFIVAKAMSQEQGAQNLLWTLINYHTSPGVLVFYGGHWNVVCGVRTDQDPMSGNYTIEGFYHQNPVWFTPPPPPPHDGSDTCGSGSSHGVANQFTTYASWLSDWFTGFNYDDPSGNNQWVSVDDPAAPRIDLPKRRPLKYLADGRLLISSQQAIKFAEMGLEEYRLAEGAPHKQILQGGRLSEPVVVHRLDRPGNYYHLVPWEHDSMIAGVIEIDARFGIFKSFYSFAAPIQGGLLDSKSSKELHSQIAKRVEGLKVQIPGEQGFVTIRPGTYCILPVLVWTPCRESWSPALPFHMVTTGSQILYVRIDGQVFTHLTTNVHGG
jgi:hypothetical protein